MALVLKDRVKETTTTTGTGSFALAGAVTGYDSFGQIGNGNTTYYAVYLDGGSEWEVGIGTYTAPSTLSRDTILASSNAGSVVTFSAGQKTIWCDYPAGKAVYTDATGSISQTIVNISGITGDISTPDSITFDTTAAETSATAKLFWDDGDGVLSNGLKGGNVTLQVGTQQYARVYNDSGTTLTKGQAVYISGAQGNRVAVKLARADVEATSFGTIGLVAETMTNGSEGFIIVSGALYKLNTTGLIAGATVYLSPTTAGAVTTTKPQAPDQLVVIGWVERVDNTVGSIYVKIDNGYELDELHDVQITSPQSGNLLIYDATTTPTGVWKNANLTDGTGITITEGAGSVTIANAGVTALSAGTGISVSGSTGSVTVTNTAPDQTVAISAGTGISVTGTYPSFTVANTGVTSVTGTSPIVSSGGTTPAISIPAANGSTNGYLTSTDWTTFNNKAASFTYTTNYIPYGQGTTTPTQSANLTFNGTTLKVIGNLGVGTNAVSIGAGREVYIDCPAASTGALNFSVNNTLTGYLYSNSTSTNLVTYGASPVLIFGTNNTERMRVDSSGNLLVGITSTRANAGDVQVAKGISFPATQSAQSDANTLDDYEEGTWTPVITAASGSLTAYTSSGRYTKVGNTVYVSGTFTITTAGTAAAYAIVNGYPFTSNSAQTFNGSCREAVFTGNIYLAQIGASATSGIIGGNANGAIVWTNNYRYDWNFTYQV